MKKIISIAVALLLITLGAGAEDSLYSGADAETAAVLQKTDGLIAQRQYKTAFDNLGTDRNEYIIARKIEICLTYFIQTDLFQEFALKDLDSTEDLSTLRSSAEDMEMIAYDPVAVAGEFTKTNGPSALLNKTLGDYYYQIYWLYQGQWIVPEEEVVAEGTICYEQAYEKNCYTADSLANYAELCSVAGKYENAITYYTAALKLDPSMGHAHFNLAIALQNTNDFDRALEEAKTALTQFATNPEYEIDALLLCSDISFQAGKTAESAEYLDQAEKNAKDDYRISAQRIRLSLAAKSYDDAGKNADALFAFYPDNPGVIQFIMREYYEAEQDTQLAAFFDRNIAHYTDSPDVLGNLYFYDAWYWNNAGDTAQTKKYAALSRENFEKAGKLDDEISSALDSLCEPQPAAEPESGTAAQTQE
jgi:tetratricopeptide (TPR) repeat protein